jgi:hypothetical protein
MSRSTIRQKTGVIVALVALVLGVTAANALGWANEQPTTGGGEEHGGNKEHGNKGGHHNENGGGNENHGNENNQPSESTPTPQTPAPQAPASTPAPPVTGQAVPGTTTPPQQGVAGAPVEQGGQESPESPVVAQETPTAAPLAPVAERKALAQTGLDPELIALLGVLCLGGGVFLFRRALVRG